MRLTILTAETVLSLAGCAEVRMREIARGPAIPSFWHLVAGERLLAPLAGEGSQAVEAGRSCLRLIYDAVCAARPAADLTGLTRLPVAEDEMSDWQRETGPAVLLLQLSEDGSTPADVRAVMGKILRDVRITKNGCVSLFLE